MSRERLTENIVALYLLQASSYVVPLISFPYLVRVLGPDRFGLLAFVQAFMQYFVMLTDYGFNLSATQAVASHHDSLPRLCRIFTAVMLAKMALLGISAVVVTVIVISVPGFRAEANVYFLTFPLVIGSALFPTWLFQGLQRMKYVTMANVGAKLAATLSLFIFVRQQADYPRAALIQSLGFLLAGLAGLFMAPKIVPIRLVRIPLSEVKETLYDGWHVFISTAAVNLYTTSNAFLLGLLTNNSVVGYFTSAERLLRAVHGALTPVTQAIYPHIAALAAKSRDLALAFIQKSLRWLALVSFVESVGLLLLARPLVHLVLGAQFAPSEALVRWMSFLPLLVAVSNVLGIQTMLTFGMQREFSRILLISGLLNIALMFPLVFLFAARGAAVSVLATECSVTTMMWILLKRRGFALIRVKERFA
jgi:polysaccharide transporter, PST family